MMNYKKPIITNRCVTAQEQRNRSVNKINQHSKQRNNSKIKFLDQDGQQGKSQLEFGQLIAEKLIQFKKNIRDLNIKYNLKHYDNITQQQCQQNMFENHQMQFPKICEFTFNGFKQVQKEVVKQCYDELFENDQLIMKITFQKIEIFDKNGQIKETKKSFPFVNQPKSENIRYNQVIQKKDEILLKETGCFVTSNIVDSYANYLQYNDEKEYFQLNSNQRKVYKRTYIFCSDFITNCTINQEQNKQKWLTLFYEVLDNFQSIQYQFWHIYRNIIFVVNLNFHWFCIRLDIDQDIMEVYDSLSKNSQSYIKLQGFFRVIFSEILKPKPNFNIKIIKKFPQQQDSYSCGYYSCIALNYLCQNQIDMSGSDKTLFLNKKEIKKILNQLLIQDDENLD